MLRSPVARGIISGAVLAASLFAGAWRIGPAPPLGPFLDPVNGVWAVAAAARMPESESVAVAGLDETVEVVFDDRGVPHVFASTVEDANRALGYVVARDRLFQLEMRWRSAGGRLSELLGPNLLRVDRAVRGLGLAWSARRDFAALDPESPAARELAAYAAGVNAWIDGLGRRDLPLEYRLLGARPARWEPVYAFYLLKLMGWDLSYGTSTDLRRLRVQAMVGKAAADALFPVNNPIQEPVQPNDEPGPRFDFARIPPPGEPDLESLGVVRTVELTLGPLANRETDSEPVPVGSNNWAVAPRRSASGYALLAGDPHLDLSLPSIWYEVQLSVPGELDVYGVTIPSVPVIVIGFNRNVAWSLTNTGADVIDYYEEVFDDPERPSRYRLDGAWRPLERTIEEYFGRGGKLLATDTLYYTHRGPVITEADRVLSMRWTVLEETVESEALRGAMRASNVREWLEAMEIFSAPAQNGIVADRGGTIAIRSTGRFPLHPDGSGLSVRDGTTRASDWPGFWPVDRYPFALNPEQGYLASANQQPIDPEVDATYLGADWPSPWRAMRINALLRADSAVTPDAMRRYQTDPGNARTEMFLPFFLDAASRLTEDDGDEEAREAARLLAEWDRRYTKDNERAVLFEYAMSELVRRTWDELEAASNDDRMQRRVATPATAILASLLHQPDNEWWDDRRSTEVVEGRDAILVASLSAALRRARQRYGEPEDGGWRWERRRHANIHHLLRLPSLSALRLPVQGGPGNLNPSSGRGVHGASWRMVVELGPELRAWSIYPGGQSGNPASPWYDDRIPKWVEGELDAVLFPRSASELDPARVAGVLVLNPER